MLPFLEKPAAQMLPFEQKISKVTPATAVVAAALAGTKAVALAGTKAVALAGTKAPATAVVAAALAGTKAPATALAGAAATSLSACSSLNEDVVFLLDWDDTLCASTHAQKTGQTRILLNAPRNGIQPNVGGSSVAVQLDEEGRSEWRHLALWVKILLHHMLMISPNGVYIVTNSQTGWVDLGIYEHPIPASFPATISTSSHQLYICFQDAIDRRSGRLVCRIQSTGAICGRNRHSRHQMDQVRQPAPNNHSLGRNSVHVHHTARAPHP
jgi:hypothetical protein